MIQVFLAEVSPSSNQYEIAPLVLSILLGFIPNILTPWLLKGLDKTIFNLSGSSKANFSKIWLNLRPIIFGAIISVLIIVVLFTNGYYKITTASFCIVLTFIFLRASWFSVSSFAKAGIVGVDPKISDGLNYKKSLTLCKHDFKFLGVGGSKLSENKAEFEAAITRSSSPTNPVRFLLCEPTSPQLIVFANRRNVGAATYQKRVRTSIDAILELKNTKNLNIEIRLYDVRSEAEMPLFRLVFLNGDLCLMSHTVFGEDIEKNLPQYWIKQWQGKNDKYSLYYAMDQYFEQLWATSNPI